MTNPGPSILEQLNQGWRAKGWTVVQLAEKSGLQLERTTMGKKMSGNIPLKDLEIQALATCLDLTIVWPSPSTTEDPANEESSSVEGAA